MTAQITEITGLWFGTWRTDPVRVILVKDSRRKANTTSSYDIAIVTTDLHSTAEAIIARYASRWAIEVAFHEGKNIGGVGDAQNRTERAVERTVPFTFMSQTITTLWYTLNANPHTQMEQRRAAAPWYRSKTDPSTFDMLQALRNAVRASRINPTTPDHATPEQNPEPQVTAQRLAS